MKTEQEYRSLLDEVAQPVVRVDINSGRFIVVNQPAAVLFGHYSPTTIESQAKITDYCNPEEWDELVSYVKKERSIYYDLKLHINGTQRWVKSKLRLNCGGSCIEGTMRDVTDNVIASSHELNRLVKIATQLDSLLATM